MTRDIMSDKAMSSVKKAAQNVKKYMGDDEHTWEELLAIEKRRRAILRRSELPFYRILTFWDGTVLRVLVTDPLMWLTMIIYVLVRVQARVGLPDYVSDIAAGDIGIIGGFLSFFLVFFVVQSNGRFDKLYEHSMNCKGRTFDVASMCRATLPRWNAARLIRYMNAAHLAGYVGLSDTYNFQNFFVEINENDRMLTDQEVKRMCEINMDMGGSCYRELVAWCMMEVETALEEDLIPLRTAVSLRDVILRLRDSVEALYDFLDQPISFFYVHFICLLSALYLPLFAVSAAYDAGTGSDVYWTADVVAGLVVFLQAVFVIGLRLLGQKMLDPYGDDVEDLSVLHYITFTWRMSNRILQSQKPEKLDTRVEADICRNRQSLGEAWEQDENKQPSNIGDYDDVVEELPADSGTYDDGVEELPADSGTRCSVQ